MMIFLKLNVSVGCLLGLLGSGLLLINCAHQQEAKTPGPQLLTTTPKALPPAPRDSYEQLIKSATRSTDQYDGFYQTFQADVTLLSAAVQSASLARRAQFLQWDSAQTQRERDRIFQDMASETKFFLRFYVPDNDNDDLNRANSIWKIYLEVQGRRLEGRARKSNQKYAELVSLYPHFNRFSTPYEVTFPIPTSALEGQTLHFIITSSLGKADFVF